MRTLKFGINAHLDYTLKCDKPHKFLLELNNGKYYVGETSEYPVKIIHDTEAYRWVFNNLPGKLIEFYPCTKPLKDYVYKWVNKVGQENLRSDLLPDMELDYEALLELSRYTQECVTT